MSTTSKEHNGLPDILCEFFEVIVHNILFVRKLYPESIFVKRKKYGVAVYKSVHPYLNEYITQSLKAVLFHLKNNQLKRILICFVNSDFIIERYVFDILDVKNNLESSDPYAIKLEQHLRSVCLKLFTTTSYLKALPEDTNFIIQLHVTEYSSEEFNLNPSFEDFPWIQVSENSIDLNCANIVPFYTVKTDSANVQIYIESSNSED